MPTRSEMRSVLAQLDAPAAGMLLTAGSVTVPIGNLDQVLWPAAGSIRLTKRDLLRYYTRIAPFLLPHVEARPVLVTCFPRGVAADGVRQSFWERYPPFAETVTVRSLDDGVARAYLLISNLPTLLWLGQLGAVELHPWLSRVGPEGDAAQLDHPDYLAVNLDGVGSSAFARAREVAFEVQRVATALGLSAYVKTSGRGGLHCQLPVPRGYTFAEVREMAEMIAQFLCGLRPDVVADVAHAALDRSAGVLATGGGGRVICDGSPNRRGRTLVAPLSPRGHPLATVSMPLTWTELADARPADFTLETAPDLLDHCGDAWHGVLEDRPAPHSLPHLI